MTTEKPSRGPDALRVSKQLVYGVPALFGLFAAALVFALLLFAASRERTAAALEQSAQRLADIRADMKMISARAASWAEFAARAVNIRPVPAGGALENAKMLWPEAVFSFFDKSGETVRLPFPALEHDTPPLPRTVRALVHDALLGNAGTGITLSRGFLALSAAAPVLGGDIRAVVVTVHLDSLTLRTLRDAASADLAVIPFGDDGRTPSVSSGAWTFTKNSPSEEEHLRTVLNTLPALRAEESSFVLGDDGLTALSVPLYDTLNVPAGLLIVAPLRTPDPVSPLLPAAGACIAGLITAPAALRLSLLYGNKILNAVASTIKYIAENAAEDDNFVYKGSWPVVLEVPLRKTARALKSWRIRTRAAEKEKKRLEAVLSHQYREPLSEKSSSDAAGRFLFDYAPVGVFRAAKNGRLLRVNAAFARLLGYDSPDMLLEEKFFFSDFYTRDDTDYLAMLSENEGGGANAVLRRRNGEAGQYSLFCFPSADAAGIGDEALEGFLLDNEAEAQILEIDQARKAIAEEHKAMALFLASICRRLQAYLLPTEREERGTEQAASYVQKNLSAEQAAADNPYEKRLAERRQSLFPVRETLYDVYQFAMSESVADPPVDVPMDLETFLQRFCSLSSFGLGARDIALRCEAETELLTRINGSAPLLRQVLRNALLLVTHEMRGGLVRISVTRDPDEDPAAGFVLFSFAWSAYADTGYSEGLVPVFSFDADGQGESADFSPDFGAMENIDEQKLIGYLVGKIDGFVRAAVFGDDVRCIDISVPLRIGEARAAAYADSSLYAPGAMDDDASAARLRPGRTYDPGAMDDDPGLVPLGDVRPTAGLYGLVDPDDPSDAGGLNLHGAGSRGAGLDILLADDNLNNRMLFSLFLRGTMHRITEARNGRECVEAFQRGRYDAVFMCMEMPIMDGYQATRVIRAFEADAGMEPTPVVAVTSYAMPEFKRQCRLAGCSEFLARPFSKTALFSLLDAFAQIKRGRNASAESRAE
ncbi:MAG: response regulator [Desulfovibrio sp.]|nr:response regulator [Desulfovibrio sp.]